MSIGRFWLCVLYAHLGCCAAIKWKIPDHHSKKWHSGLQVIKRYPIHHREEIYRKQPPPMKVKLLNRAFVRKHPAKNHKGGYADKRISLKTEIPVNYRPFPKKINKRLYLDRHREHQKRRNRSNNAGKRAFPVLKEELDSTFLQNARNSDNGPSKESPGSIHSLNGDEDQPTAVVEDELAFGRTSAEDGGIRHRKSYQEYLANELEGAEEKPLRGIGTRENRFRITRPIRGSNSDRHFFTWRNPDAEGKIKKYENIHRIKSLDNTEKDIEDHFDKNRQSKDDYIKNKYRDHPYHRQYNDLEENDALYKDNILNEIKYGDTKLTNDFNNRPSPLSKHKIINFRDNIFLRGLFERYLERMEKASRELGNGGLTPAETALKKNLFYKADLLDREKRFREFGSSKRERFPSRLSSIDYDDEEAAERIRFKKFGFKNSGFDGEDASVLRDLTLRKMRYDHFKDIEDDVNEDIYLESGLSKHRLPIRYNDNNVKDRLNYEESQALYGEERGSMKPSLLTDELHYRMIRDKLSLLKSTSDQKKSDSLRYWNYSQRPHWDHDIPPRFAGGAKTNPDKYYPVDSTEEYEDGKTPRDVGSFSSTLILRNLKNGNMPSDIDVLGEYYFQKLKEGHDDYSPNTKVTSFHDTTFRRPSGYYAVVKHSNQRDRFY